MTFSLPHPSERATGVKTDGHASPLEHYLPLHHTTNMLAPHSWRFIVSLMALKHGVMQREIMGKGRTRRVAAARHESVALIYRHTQASMPGVGRHFDMDHSTVHYALMKVFGSTAKLVERPAPPPPPPVTAPRGTALILPRGKDGKFRQSTALQKAIKRAYHNNVHRDVVVQEYGCSPKSVNVIAHHMGLRRKDFKPKSKYGMAQG